MAHTEMGDGEAHSKSISQLQTAEDLCKKVESLKRGRQFLERDWKLNLAFYKGKQYAWYNPYARRIESLPTEDGEKPRYRVRLVSNQIVTGAHSLLAKFTKTKPTMTATPGSGSDDDVKAAQLAERLLDYWWSEFSLDSKLEEALLWGIIGGQGYWKITWDQHAGKSMKFMLDPMGQPIVDDALKDAFRGQLAQFGIKPQERTVYVGDIRVEVMSPFDVLVDPSARVFEDAKYVFCRHHLDPDEIRTRWGVDVKPDAVPASEDSTLPFDNAADRSEKTVKEIWIGYFKPGPYLPQGRYVVFMDNPKQVIADEPWPYPTDELPLVKFPGIRVPGQVYDDAVVTQARPLQKELNKTLSQIVEYKNLMIRPRVWAPVGSLRTKITTEAGAAFEYVPIQGMKPEPEQLPTLPAYVFEHLKDVSARLNEMFGLTEVTEGSVPPNVEAGIAIDLLQEMATDRLAPTIKLIEGSIARAGQIMLGLAQAYYAEPRLLKIKGSGGSTQVKRFTQADIAGSIDIRAEAGTGLPRTRAGRQARIMELVQNGIMPMEKAWKHLDIADIKGIALEFQADEDKAYREHEKLLQGVPLNPDAVQNAMMSVNAGINPETGQPLSGDPMEAQAILERAALSPAPSDNHAIHDMVHRLFMNSVEFESLPLEIQRRFVIHYTSTQAAIPKPAGENDPKVNLNARLAVGPTTAAEILRKTGVEVDPEVIATEPPMETWVTDSVDKPDVDAGSGGQDGDDPRVEKERELARKAKADADFAEKKAKQGPPRPAPKGKK